MPSAIRVTGSKMFPPAIACLWLAALVPGIRYLLAYERTPGRAGEPPASWISGATSLGNAHLPTLVVVLHPRCSCTSATLMELEEAAAGFNHPYNALMLIYQARGESYEWRNTSSYREVQRVLNANVVLDTDGKKAAGLGAFTSGAVLYYSAAHDGRRNLLFSGGVTGGRGMVGPNAGIQALKQAMNAAQHGDQSSKSALNTNVYGCGLSAFSGVGPKQAIP